MGEQVEEIQQRKERIGAGFQKLSDVLARRSSSDSAGSTPAAALEYYPVICQGHLQPSKSILVGPRTRTTRNVATNGYILLTPLLPEKGSSEPPVLVNLGWVPADWDINASSLPRAPVPRADAPTSRAKGNTTPAPPSTVTIQGVVRAGEKPSLFVPPNDPAKGTWFWMEVPALCKAAGLPEGSLLVEAVATDGDAVDTLPLRKPLDDFLRFSVMPDDHVQYAATWFTLSAAVWIIAWRASAARASEAVKAGHKVLP
eukprot:jgi/Mesvir1/23933/Mv10708-RA.1